MAQEYDEARFKAALHEALAVTERVLGTARHPVLPEDCSHVYEDKYLLAEAQLTAAVSTCLEGLKVLGLTLPHLATAAGWARAGHAVTLRFSLSTRCVFARKVEREVEGPRTHTTVSGSVLSNLTLTSQQSVFTKVTDYYFTADAQWSLEAVRGAGREAADRVQLATRTTPTAEIKTGSEAPPHHGSVHAPVELPVTWLLQQLEAREGPLQARVRIDRSHKDCATPRRNKDTDAALAFFDALSAAASALAGRVGGLLDIERLSRPNTPLCRAPLNAQGLFLPYLLFEEGAAAAAAAAAPPQPAEGAQQHVVAQVGGSALAAPAAAAGGGAGSSTALVAAPPPSALMDLGSINRLLAESFQGLQGRCEAVAAELPPPTSPAFLSGSEGKVLVVADFLGRAIRLAADGVGYIEGLLRAQVCAAVGKVLMPGDFAGYMKFHARKLFKGEYAPRPMCFTVRRSSEHSPEGVISIVEAAHASGGAPGAPADPIFTVSARVPPGTGEGRFMDFALSAETRVRFGGERFLHAWLSTKFSGEESVQPPGRHVYPPASALSLVASSRQFSSFILCVGKISSATSFDLVSAIIIKDKDELTIPLAVSELPTPKEFKDAIASLSPEQQRFCKAFRGMQLESTLFGVMVLHIKPQLEALLRLAPDSLTKEVALTQDLMDLFITYQIPADLLSYGGPEDGDRTSRLTAVKGHVAAIKAMIKGVQDADIEQKRQEARFAQPLHEEEGACLDVPETMARPAMRMAAKSSRPMPMAMASRAMAPMAPMLRAAMPMAMEMAAPMAFSAPAMEMAAPMAFSFSASPPPPPPPLPPPQSAAVSVSAAMDAAGSGASAAASSGGAATPAAAGTGGGGAGDLPSGMQRDLTKVPAELDARYETLDTDAALRASIISASGPWTKSSMASILAKPVQSVLDGEAQGKARSAAFDLLDALSRSGALPMEHAALHVIMGAVYRFDEGLMDTVVKGNINPIEKAERSFLIMATTLHQLPAAALVNREQVERLTGLSPALFPAPALADKVD